MTTIEAGTAAPDATTTTPEPDSAAATLHYLDPRALAANPANVRRDLGDLTPLVASIRSVGVLEPLIVIPDGNGGHLIVAGHRRNQAAIEADQPHIPCLVRPDLAAAHATAQVVAMLVENEQRLALSPGGPSGIAFDATFRSPTRSLCLVGFRQRTGRVGLGVGSAALGR